MENDDLLALAKATNSLLVGKTLVRPVDTFSCVVDMDCQDLLLDCIQGLVSENVEVTSQEHFESVAENFLWEIIDVLKESGV